MQPHEVFKGISLVLLIYASPWRGTAVFILSSLLHSANSTSAGFARNPGSATVPQPAGTSGATASRQSTRRTRSKGRWYRRRWTGTIRCRRCPGFCIFTRVSVTMRTARSWRNRFWLECDRRWRYWLTAWALREMKVRGHVEKLWFFVFGDSLLSILNSKPSKEFQDSCFPTI